MGYMDDQINIELHEIIKCLQEEIEEKNKIIKKLEEEKEKHNDKIEYNRLVKQFGDNLRGLLIKKKEFEVHLNMMLHDKDVLKAMGNQKCSECKYNEEPIMVAKEKCPLAIICALDEGIDEWKSLESIKDIIKSLTTKY